MNPTEKKRLQKKGWKFGSAADFLGLSPEEAAYIDMRLSLARAVLARRKKKSLTQAKLAELLGSSQSRVAKMETGDPSVSLDLQVRALLLMDTMPTDVGKALVSSFTKKKVKKTKAA